MPSPGDQEKYLEFLSILRDIDILNRVTICVCDSVC